MQRCFYISDVMATFRSRTHTLMPIKQAILHDTMYTLSDGSGSVTT